MHFLNNDLYKFTMQNAVLHHFPSAEAEYKLIIRSKVDLRPFREKIEKKIDQLCQTRITLEELSYLRTIRFLKKDYVDFLEDFTFKRRFIEVYEENISEEASTWLGAGGRQGGNLQIRVRGPWAQVILFEVPILAIISEVYMTSQNGQHPVVGLERLNAKIDYIKHNNLEIPIADFGTRRRYSESWQEYVVSKLKDELPNFIGTSNVYLAMRYGLKPIGTMAHEWLQAGQGLGMCPLVNSQKYMLDIWAKEYRGDLGIALTDTIGIDSFLEDFDPYFAKLYDGVRHDSGDPITWGEKIIAHYKKFGIDPMTKSAVFSDNLNFQKAAEILNHFKGRIKVSFGIGTNITNDTEISPLSVVMKLVRLNGNPVAKISDEPGKVICEDFHFLSYLKKVFKLEKIPTAEEYFSSTTGDVE